MEKAAAPAVPALVPLLQDRDESVRTAAAEAIAQVGPLDQAATDALVLGLDSRDNVVRARRPRPSGPSARRPKRPPRLWSRRRPTATTGCAPRPWKHWARSANAAAIAVPGLMRALRDRDNWVSALAAEALGQMGESADGAIPALVRSLSHLNAEVRRNAAEALGKMGGSRRRRPAVARKAAHDEDGGVRSQAIRALGAIGMPDAGLDAMVLAGLQDPDPHGACRRRRVPGPVGRAERGDPERPDCCLLDDANDQVKVEVTKVLPKLAGATPAVIDGLCRRLLEDDSDWVQVYAALALGKLGRAGGGRGRPPAPRRPDRGSERARTGHASDRHDPTTRDDRGIRRRSQGCLRRHSRMVASAGWMNATAIAEEAIPALVEALGDPEVQVRANCAHALARLDAIPAAAIPLLDRVHGRCQRRPANERGDGTQRWPPPAAVIEVMQRLVADPNSRVRLIAASSLLSAESGNTIAGAVLLEALEDPAPRVREAAHGAARIPRCRGRGLHRRLEGTQRTSGTSPG